MHAESTYLIRGTLYRSDSPALQGAFSAVYGSERPRCLCVERGVEMYVAQRRSSAFFSRASCAEQRRRSTLRAGGLGSGHRPGGASAGAHERPHGTRHLTPEAWRLASRKCNAARRRTRARARPARLPVRERARWRLEARKRVSLPGRARGNGGRAGVLGGPRPANWRGAGASLAPRLGGGCRPAQPRLQQGHSANLSLGIRPNCAKPEPLQRGFRTTGAFFFGAPRSRAAQDPRATAHRFAAPGSRLQE
jgi:hypothetical protein